MTHDKALLFTAAQCAVGCLTAANPPSVIKESETDAKFQEFRLAVPRFMRRPLARLCRRHRRPPVRQPHWRRGLFRCLRRGSIVPAFRTSTRWRVLN